jgi:hypothetical protein
LILTRHLSFSEPQRPKRQMSLEKSTILMASSSPTADPHIRRTAQALPLPPSLEAHRSRPNGHPPLSNPALYQRLTISTSRRSLPIAFDLHPFNPAEVRLAFLVMLIQWSARFVHRCCFNCVACRQLVPTTDHLRSAARARLPPPSKGARNAADADLPRSQGQGNLLRHAHAHRRRLPQRGGRQAQPRPDLRVLPA